jgi:hypothetical protein
MSQMQSRTHLTPPVIAEQLGCNVASILTFIHSGQLKATNLGHATRPRWRICRDDLRNFLDSRSNQLPRTPPVRQRVIAKPKKRHI